MMRSALSRDHYYEEADFDSRYNPIVKIIVGSKEFQVHKNTICRSSQFFKEAFKSSLEAKVQIEEKTMDLDVYIYWLYTGVLRVSGNNIDYPELLFFAELYLRGQDWEDAELQDATVAAFLETVRASGIGDQNYFAECIKVAYTGYEGIMPQRHSTLQKALVEIMAREEAATVNSLMEEEDVDDKFAQDLIKRLLELRKSRLPIGQLDLDFVKNKEAAKELSKKRCRVQE